MKNIFKNKKTKKAKPQRDPKMEFETKDNEGGSFKILTDKYLLMFKK